MCAVVLQKGERELRVQPALPVPVDLIKVSVEWKVRWSAAITGPQWGLFKGARDTEASIIRYTLVITEKCKEFHHHMVLSAE